MKNLHIKQYLYKVMKQITDYWLVCPQTRRDRPGNNLLCWRSVARRSNPKQLLAKCPADTNKTNELEMRRGERKRKCYQCISLSIGIERKCSHFWSNSRHSDDDWSLIYFRTNTHPIPPSTAPSARRSLHEHTSAPLDLSTACIAPLRRRPSVCFAFSSLDPWNPDRWGDNKSRPLTSPPMDYLP